ncbi:hypothetical protein YC2023_072144 [Brassica napus]
MSVAVHQYTYHHYTQDVRGCPPAHTRRSWPSVSTHRTSVAVRVCPCISVSTHRTSVAVCGCPTHMTSMAVHQYTYQHVGPLTQHADPSRGLFGHRGCLWLSVSTHMTSVAVCVCPCVSVSTHRTSVGVRQHKQDVRCCPCVSVCVRQHKQDIRGCPSEHTGRLSRYKIIQDSLLKAQIKLMASSDGAIKAIDSKHFISIYFLSLVHFHTFRESLVEPIKLYLCEATPKHLDLSRLLSIQSCGLLNTPSFHSKSFITCIPSYHPSDHLFGRPIQASIIHLAHPDFQPVTTQDVCGLDTGRLWVSVSTHRTSVGVRQHTQDVRGCPCVSVCVRVCPSAHTERLWLSISTHISTLVLGLSTLTLPADCSGDFGPRGLSVQYTQDVCGCPSAYTGRPWVSVSPNRTSVYVRQHTQDVCGCLCVSVCVRQHTQDIRGYPSVHISARWSLDSACWPFTWTVRVIFAHVGCLFSTHRTSVGVRQHRHDVRGCPCLSVSTHRTSVAVRVCPCVSVTTHRTSVAIHQYTYQHVGPWTQHADPSPWTVRMILAHVGCLFSIHRTSMGVRQHRQDVRGCLWLSVSTHRTSVCVRQHTHDVRGCPSEHISARWSLDSAHCSFPWTVRDTQYVRGCQCVSVCVRVCPSAHTERLWLSFSTHISTLAIGLSTLTLPVDCSGDFGTCGLSVQYAQDVCGCLAAHTERPCVSVSTHKTSVCVRVCPSAHTGRSWLSISTYISTLVPGLSTLTLPMDCSGDFGPRGLSVQYTQDVRGYPPAYTGRLWLSVCVRLCSSAHT